MKFGVSGSRPVQEGRTSRDDFNVILGLYRAKQAGRLGDSKGQVSAAQRALNQASCQPLNSFVAIGDVFRPHGPIELARSSEASTGTAASRH